MTLPIENTKLNALIIDDERLAVEGVKLLLADFPEIHIMGSTGCIDGAVTLINKTMPDIIFLDIQLQGETGFDLFKKVQISSHVIFITAFDYYAVRAFEVNALDYLLKPVGRSRFKKSMDRVLHGSEMGTTRYSMLDYTDTIVLNTGHSISFTKLNKIQCITAEGDYSRVWIHNKKSELILKTLKAWEAILPINVFIRINRSAIVNSDYIQNVNRTTSNRFAVHLNAFDSPLFISQRFARKIKSNSLINSSFLITDRWI